MDFFSAMEILSSGLSAQRTRMNVASGNLANANTTKTAEGGAYKRRDPIFVSQPLARERFGALLDNQLRKSAQTVQVAGIQEDQTPPRTVHDPSHPHADENGYVQMPNINLVEEMVNLLMAARAYESNVTALTSINQMAQRAMQIGQ